MATRATKKLIVGIGLAIGTIWSSSAYALWDCGKWFYGNVAVGRGGFYRNVCVDDHGGVWVGVVRGFGTRGNNDWINFE